MEQSDVALIAHDVILNFPKKIEKPFVMFLPKIRFSRYLNLMQLKKHVDKTPCFVAEMREGAVIYYCLEVINCLTKGFSREKEKLFVEAVTLHELFHLWNKVTVLTSGAAESSEELAWEELNILYPQQSAFLRSFLRQRTKSY